MRRAAIYSFLGATLGVGILAATAGCSRQWSPPDRPASETMADTREIEVVRSVLAKHKNQILARYDAAGVGIGKAHPTSAEYVIVVYLKSPERRPDERVVIDGIPLKFEIAGPFKPL